MTLDPAEADAAEVPRRYKGQEGVILEALDRLRLIPGRGQVPPVIPQPAPLQARLLNPLNVDPLRLMIMTAVMI